MSPSACATPGSAASSRAQYRSLRDLRLQASRSGSYIVEILANDETVLAASQLLNASTLARRASAVVKLPFKKPPFAGMMRHVARRRSVSVVLEAAATGITALVPTAPISPNQ